MADLGHVVFCFMIYAKATRLLQRPALAGK